MSVESAVSYIHRMRSDEVFKRAVNDLAEDEVASWQYIKESGYEFTMEEFRAAQDEVYKEYGITPM
jgi:predicted ribosomally synthesized peptide with nif11-like leader